MKFELNELQENIIKCFFDNGICFVNASAGTGKTSTITELYLNLLEKKEKVSDIAVITFTKAAANEMLLRIRLKVRNKIYGIKESNDDKSIKEKKYWQSVYKDILTSAKISTINSFANSIAAENAMHLSIPPNMSILEDNMEIQETLKNAVFDILRKEEYAGKIRSLYRIATEESKNIFADKILNFLLKIKPRLENIQKFEEKALEASNIKDKYGKIYNDISYVSNFLINDDGSENNTIKSFKVLIKNTISSISKLSNIDNIKNINENEFEDIKYAVNLVLSKKNSCGNKK